MNLWGDRPMPSWFKVLFVAWCLLTGIGWLVNGGDVRLAEPFERYRIQDHHMYQSRTWVSSAGVKTVRHWIEQRTRPAYGIFTLAWQHLWYNCITSGYDLNFWIEEPERSLPSYGIYQSGNTLFLRVEPSCWHRVLIADFTAAELESLLASYTVPIPAELPPGQ